MDSLPPQPEPGAIDSVGNLAVWFATGLIAAGTICLRKATSIKVAAYHILLSSMLGPATCLVTFWYKPELPRWVGLIICVGVGLTIFAWAVWLEKISKRIGDTDPALILQDKLNKVLPRTPKDLG